MKKLERRPETRVAVVTGANRGIGFEIARQLARRGMRVVLSSRDKDKGKTAQKVLAEEGWTVDYHPLDVTDRESIQAMRAYLVHEYGGVDVLINNAGIGIDGGKSLLKLEIDTVRETMETNVYGPLCLCQALIPLMKRHNYGRIVNLSSSMGQLATMGTVAPSYRISKTALNAVTRIVAAELEGTNILVNSMCPGWVRTDMGGHNAPRSVEEGADTAVWLAQLPDSGPSGGFFRDRKAIDW